MESYEYFIEQSKKDYTIHAIKAFSDPNFLKCFSSPEVSEMMNAIKTFSSSVGSAEQQYLAVLAECYKYGTDVKNERTGSICRTILNQQIKFNGKEFPLLTTRKMYWKQAIGEMVAYIRKYTKLSDFHSLGVHTWDKNAEGWTEISDYNGEKKEYNRVPSTGLIYGASADAVNFNYEDLLESIRTKPNDRGHIWNFWNPSHFYKGCLRPCMYSHNFSVLKGTLHLTSTSRSMDLPLGGAFNLVQCWFLLNITAKLTGLKVGTVTLNITNAHIYEDQLSYVLQQITREPKQVPTLEIKDNLDFDVLNQYLNKDNFDEYFELQNYDPHPAIKYPFTA